MINDITSEADIQFEDFTSNIPSFEKAAESEKRICLGILQGRVSTWYCITSKINQGDDK